MQPPPISLPEKERRYVNSTQPKSIRSSRLWRTVSKARVLVLALAAVMAVPATANASTVVTSNTTNTDGGYFYSFWSQDSGQASMTLDGSNGYSTTWTNVTNFVAGKGWNPGTTAPVTYSGTWNCNGNCYLSLYGWTTNPLIEYYIVDNYGNYNPSSGATKLGSVVSDGSTYDLYQTDRVNQPSIQGTATFKQFWAIRQSKRTGGTITVDNFFKAWASAGLNLGTPNYEILATEGYGSSGNSNIKVSQGTSTGGTTGGSTGGSTSDTTAPSVPGGLKVTGTTSNSASLSWTASTDNTAVTGYNVYRNGTKVGTTSGTSYTDSGLSASTAYSYTVSAYDAAGNTSAATSAVSATTASSTGGSTGGTGTSSGCTATYANSQDWGSGFTGTVTVKNNGTAATKGWKVNWTFPGNQTITSLWNGTYTQSGTAVTVNNTSSNGTISAGGTTTFGFNANYSGSNTAPALSCTAS